VFNDIFHLFFSFFLWIASVGLWAFHQLVSFC
jgi:hypothetical protein